MAGLLVALIVLAAFGVFFWMLEGEDWNRIRHRQLPHFSTGPVGPWMRDVLHMRGDGGRQQPQQSVAPVEPPKPPERSVEDSVYDRLYGGRRSVRKQARDD
jgi:hypothetical protein